MSHRADTPAFQSRRAERALSMVEMLVVLLIIGILLGTGLAAVAGARKSGRTLGATAVAHAYADSADRFAREHRGRYPSSPGGADWDSGAAAEKGPFADLLGSRRYYLRTVPESVQDRSVVVEKAGDARIRYRQLGGGGGYELLLDVTGRPQCALRGGDTSGSSSAPACSER